MPLYLVVAQYDDGTGASHWVDKIEAQSEYHAPYAARRACFCDRGLPATTDFKLVALVAGPTDIEIQTLRIL